MRIEKFSSGIYMGRSSRDINCDDLLQAEPQIVDRPLTCLFLINHILN